MARTDALKEALAKVAGGDFILVELGSEGPMPIYDGSGQLLCFKTGEEAEREATRQTDRIGRKVQPRRAVNAAWKDREIARMKDGTYTPLPWSKEKWWDELADVHKDHFPHVSLQKTALISFTEDPTKGSADLQTVMKPGRYLERFFKDRLNEYIIRDLCCVFSKHYEDNKLTFAETADEIEEVYVNGPASCMSKEKSAYKCEVHPTTAYAAGDLQVAYIRREGRIVARSIVWPERKIYNNIYGDKGRLEPLLTKQGFKAGVPEGARLTAIKRPEGKLYRFIAPHVDGSMGVYVDGDFLKVLGPKKEHQDRIEVPGGGGLTELVGYKCECEGCAKDALPQRSIISHMKGETERTSTMCKSCGDKNLIIDHDSGVFIEKTHAVEMASGEFGWVRNVKMGRLSICSGSGKYWHTSDMVLLPDGTRWSTIWFRKHGKNCNTCSGAMRRADGDCMRCVSVATNATGHALRSSIAR